jgi:hypothetical protein
MNIMLLVSKKIISVVVVSLVNCYLPALAGYRTSLTLTTTEFMI